VIKISHFWINLEKTTYMFAFALTKHAAYGSIET